MRRWWVSQGYDLLLPERSAITRSTLMALLIQEQGVSQVGLLSGGRDVGRGSDLVSGVVRAWRRTNAERRALMHFESCMADLWPELTALRVGDADVRALRFFPQRPAPSPPPSRTAGGG